MTCADQKQCYFPRWKSRKILVASAYICSPEDLFVVVSYEYCDMPWLAISAVFSDFSS